MLELTLYQSCTSLGPRLIGPTYFYWKSNLDSMLVEQFCTITGFSRKIQCPGLLRQGCSNPSLTLTHPWTNLGPRFIRPTYFPWKSNLDSLLVEHPATKIGFPSEIHGLGHLGQGGFNVILIMIQPSPISPRFIRSTYFHWISNLIPMSVHPTSTKIGFSKNPRSDLLSQCCSNLVYCLTL